MRLLIFCVVIELVTAYANTVVPLIPKTSANSQNRLYDGLSLRTFYPQQSNDFVYISRPIIPYLMERVNKVFKNQDLRRIPFVIERSINSLVFNKIPKTLTKYFYPKQILNRFLDKKIIYKLRNGAVYINGIRNLIFKLLRNNRNIFSINTNKNHKTDLTQFTTHKVKDSKPYQEVLRSQTILPINDELSVLESKNQNKPQIRNIAKSKTENNIGVSGKNNQDNRKIIIKDLHINIGGNVSNVANKSNIKNNEDNASTNVTLLNPSSTMNKSIKDSEVNYKKDNTVLKTNNSLTKINDNHTTKYLSTESDNLAFIAENITNLNLWQTNNTKLSKQKALNYIQPNNSYHIYYKVDIPTKNLHEVVKNKGHQEINSHYNIRKTLGYHNLHQIVQGRRSDKTENNKERTNKIKSSENTGKKIQKKEYQFENLKGIENNTRHLANNSKTGHNSTIVTTVQNLLTKHTATRNEREKTQYDKPLEIKIEGINGNGKMKNEYMQPSSNILNNMKLNSDKKHYEKNVQTKTDREDSKTIENINKNKNIQHNIANLEDVQGIALRHLIKPIKLTKVNKISVKETKTITFGDESENDQNYYVVKNKGKINVPSESVYELLLLKDNDSPLVKKVIETEYETSDKIKLNNGNDESNIIYVILNNIYSENKKNSINNNSHDKTCTNKHISLPVKDHSHSLNSKNVTLFSEKDSSRYEAKKAVCSDCKKNEINQNIKNVDGLSKKVQVQSTVQSTFFNENIKMKDIQNKSHNWNVGETLYDNSNRHNQHLTGNKDLKTKSIHVIKRKTSIDNPDNENDSLKAMTNKDKVIANILAPQDVKSDKKLLPYWLPSDAQEVYEILQQPSKDGAVIDNLDLETTLKEEIDKIVQLKKELGNENLEEIINLKINTVGIGKATNINDKLIPSLYEIYLKNFITKILYRLRQELRKYEDIQQKNELTNVDIHEIRKINSVINIFERVRDVFNEQDDELLHDLLVSLLRFNKQSDEDFDEEVKVILDTVSRKHIYGVLRYFLVPEPTLDVVRDYLKQQELYPQFVYLTVLENISPNIRTIIINVLAIREDNYDDIHKNEKTMDKLVKSLIILDNVMKELSIPETTQRFIIEESILDIVRNLANAYIKNYEKTVYVQMKKQLQDALYNNINV